MNDNVVDMKKSIFNYFYSYNYHIKHSRVNRLILIEYLKNEFSKNKDMFKYTFKEFNLKNKVILDSYRVGIDKYWRDSLDMCLKVMGEKNENS